MMNPVVDDYTKTLHHRKILKKRKNQPTENQKNTKLKFKLSGGPLYAFSLLGLAVRTPGPPSVIPLLFMKLRDLCSSKSLLRR